MPLDSMALLERYFDDDALEVVAIHGMAVAELALAVGRSLCLTDDDLTFLDEAVRLHDIGVCRVHAPGIGMLGAAPYILHGVIGREILEKEGLPLHALVCERHIGVGLTMADIIAQKLPLPLRDMSPRTLAEEIICFSDLFFSKKPGKLLHRKSPERVRHKLAGFGEAKAQIFDAWLLRFGMAL